MRFHPRRRPCASYSKCIPAGRSMTPSSSMEDESVSVSIWKKPSSYARSMSLMRSSRSVLRTASVPRCLQATIVACFALESRSRSARFNRWRHWLWASTLVRYPSNVSIDFFLDWIHLSALLRSSNASKGAFPSNSRSILYTFANPCVSAPASWPVFFIFANTGERAL